GIITLAAGTNMLVEQGSLIANPQGPNGDGAQLSFTVSNGALGFLGELSADAVGTGAGGKITISVNSSTPFSIRDGDSVSGVSGVIHADAGLAVGASGDGGTVSITQNGSGGIRFGNVGLNALVAVDGAPDGGNGGTITINTGSGGLIVATGGQDAQLLADAFCGNGGTVTLNMASLTIDPLTTKSIDIFARGFGGAGGTVNLSLANKCQDLVIGDNPGEFQIFAG